MQQYRQLIREILANGDRKPTRAKLESTGENIDAISIFGWQSRYDLTQGFPLLTLKKMHWSSIVHELIWFLKGNEDIIYLQRNGIKIWDQWAKGRMVRNAYPMYWRRWEDYTRYYDKHCSCPSVSLKIQDQITNLVAGIKETISNPTASVARRLIVSSWNPHWIADAGLPPCHVLSQFNVTNGRLSCHLYQRSADAFLGVPFNIASYALLTHLLAHYTGLKVGKFIHTFGDVHIYTNHIDQCMEMLNREDYPLPTIFIKEHVRSYKDLNELKFEDIELLNYKCHSALRGEVAV